MQAEGRIVAERPNRRCSAVEAAWESIRTGLRRDLGTRTFDGWLKPAELGTFDPDNGALDIVMPSQFMADWVRSHFGERLGLAWKTVLPIVREVRVIAAADAPRPAPLLILEEFPPPAERDPNAPNFDPRYRFETFVLGKANEVAATAARTLATSPTVGFNPLFIHGGTGRGKTHLLHAIGHAFLARNRGARVVSMSAEKFMVEFIRALKENDTIGFKQRLRNADLLLIDDVQFIAGKDSTQEEFFHTMNEIITAGRRLVITSDRAPQDLDGIAPRILSRLSWGLVADINSADYELRFNIIVAKLEALPGVEMPRPVIDFLARRVTSSIRELEGALNRIGAYAMMTGRDDRRRLRRGSARQRPSRQPAPHLDRRDPDAGRRALSHPQGGDDLRPPRPRGRPSAPGRDVSVEAADAEVAAGHRPPLRWPRPYDGHPCGASDRKAPRSDAELDADIRLLTRQLEG